MITKQIEAQKQQETAEQQQKIARLVKIYEAMKPKDAAGIFNSLDIGILLQVMQRMKEAKTAPILAAMEPSRAQDVTAALLAKRPDPTDLSQAAQPPTALTNEALPGAEPSPANLDTGAEGAGQAGAAPPLAPG
jgi:flagellar motility protein MotE (MotC chaperone)